MDKKYYLILVVLVFIFGIILWQVTSGQTFEVYETGGHPYPTVTNINATIDDTNSVVTISATAKDVSGVNSMIAKITNLLGVQVGDSILMTSTGTGCSSPNTPCDYVGIVNVSIVDVSGDAVYKLNENYTIDIYAMDKLNNVNDSGTYTATFIRTYKNTELAMTTSNLTPVAGKDIIFSATLKYTGGAFMPDKILTFTDTKSGNVIGTATTNASGVATITYHILLTASLGSRNIKVDYAGVENVIRDSSATITLTVGSPGICSTSFGITMCAAINTIETTP